MPTEMEDYLFDLRGYIILQGALDRDHVRELNAIIDELLPIAPGAWKGHMHRMEGRGLNDNNFFVQNMYEAGEPFERLIDHPAWMEHMTRFVGGDDGLFIDEGCINIRRRSGALPLHSGAHKRRTRTQFRFHNNMFRCGLVNVLMALTDIGKGDGATMVLPGSHKSNLLHPAFKRQPDSLDEVEAATEVHLNAGDVLVFVDCMAHGAARRTNPGERRIVLYRYGPHWANNRYGYQLSDALLARLTPARRKILQPLPPKGPPAAQTGRG